MKTLSFILFALAVFQSEVLAQARKPTAIAELASYRAADREAILYGGAKTEGKIIWYTSLAGDSYKELVKAFETKYSGVKVESYRAAGAELVVRLEEEAKARRNIADTIETTEGSLIFLRDEKLLRPYDSPHLDRFPEDGKERADKGLVYWALARESYIGFAYNKNLVPSDAVPKNFDGSFIRNSK
jgi:ABC-type glycerol-3-phosphate transport system substrate-binding protein